MSAKTSLLEGLSDLTYEQKIVLLDKICMFNSTPVELKQTTKGDNFTIEGFDLLDGVITKNNIDEALTCVINRFTKGANCADTALMIIKAACQEIES